jgi:hypothetical protein
MGWTGRAPSAMANAACLGSVRSAARQIVYLRHERNGEDQATYLTEVGSDGRRLRRVEVGQDGTGIKTDAEDRPFNPPLVGLFDPHLPDQEIDRRSLSGHGRPHNRTTKATARNRQPHLFGARPDVRVRSSEDKRSGSGACVATALRYVDQVLSWSGLRPGAGTSPRCPAPPVEPQPDGFCKG